MDDLLDLMDVGWFRPSRIHIDENIRECVAT